jgi:hypothetical protein
MSAIGLRPASALALLLLSACANPLYYGRDAYAEGMRRLRYDPGASPEYFEAAERDFAEALADDHLDTSEQVMAITMRARCLIELERHADVPGVLGTPLPGYQADKMYPGDLIGLALLKASKLDPERAYTELLLAEKKAATLKSRLHIAWTQVHVLQRIGTPKAKEEAIRICAAHAGKLDFDALKQGLTQP